MNQLHPGIKNLWRIEGYGGLILVILFIFFQLFSLSSESYFFKIFILISLFFLFLVIVFTEIYVQMAYKRWKYEITQTEVKIERGILLKKYTSIPYERVQNVDIRRGVVARLFGFSTVDIETAGRSGFQNRYGGLSYGRRGIFGRRNKYESEGHIPAISIEGAEKIREFIMKKISSSENDGM